MAARLIFCLLASVTVLAHANSICAKWCTKNFLHPGSSCVSLAAQGKGPCYICGPLKPPRSTAQLRNGVCVDMSKDMKSCGGSSSHLKYSSRPTSSSTFSASTMSSSTTSSAPPSVRTCELGTAFGYQQSDSVTLNTQPGSGCNRWGWYETPTLAELQSGISGILYVGAGGNNIANAINVGTWTAVASPTGGVTVTYSLTAGYFIDEAHIDLDCLPIDTCAPAQYTFNSGALPNLPVYANPTPLQYPTCSGGSQAYLILHGSINYLTTATTCPPPVAA